MCLPTDFAMWQEFEMFLAMFCQLDSAFMESDSMIQRLSSPDWIIYLIASSMAFDSALYIEHLSDSLSWITMSPHIIATSTFWLIIDASV
jgi:hypothetical protein